MSIVIISDLETERIVADIRGAQIALSFEEACHLIDGLIHTVTKIHELREVKVKIAMDEKNGIYTKVH